MKSRKKFREFRGHTTYLPAMRVIRAMPVSYYRKAAMSRVKSCVTGTREWLETVIYCYLPSPPLYVVRKNGARPCFTYFTILNKNVFLYLVRDSASSTS
jgi:hypothetical protein